MTWLVFPLLFSQAMKNLKYLVICTLFGIILTKSEVSSWFRIQEMFRCQAFHLYGVIGSAVVLLAALAGTWTYGTLRERLP